MFKRIATHVGGISSLTYLVAMLSTADSIPRVYASASECVKPLIPTSIALAAIFSGLYVAHLVFKGSHKSKQATLESYLNRSEQNL
jgi:hypothetical protein